MSELVGKESNFSILYPRDWIMELTPNGMRGDKTVVASLIPPMLPETGAYGGIRKSLKPLEKLEDVAMWGKQISQSDPTYQPQAIERVLFNSEETLLQKHTWLSPSTPLQKAESIQCINNYRLHNGIGYIIVFCVSADKFEQLHPIFMKMLESFRYLD